MALKAKFMSINVTDHIEWRSDHVVTDADIASGFGADFPPAASTPFILGLVEVACHNAIASELEDGQITVGTEAKIRHLAPSPVGAALRVEASLGAVSPDGRRLDFNVTVIDDGQICARIEHRRHIVDSAQMLARLRARADAPPVE